MTKLVIAYIGLGSNLNSPVDQLNRALAALAEQEFIKDIRCSPWYQSHAIGPGQQPDYLNAVVEMTTSLLPDALLTVLQTIENQQGRTRDVRWAARTLDLDILIYDKIIMTSERLTIPHPEIRHRSFVLKPLFDLSPELRLPSGESVSQLLSECDSSDLVSVHSQVDCY